MARAATPAITALLTAGIPHEVLQYDHDPRRESYGEEAVQELVRVEGADPDQVFKTLVVASDALPKGLGVAVLPVPSKLSLKAAAAALGVSKVTMAEPAAAERATGYVVGGLSPFGQRKALPTVVDASALRWNRVLVSAGKRGWEVAVHPQDLIRLTGAVIADIQA
ncbi:Cys-tRNA(Pro) deacylase [Mycolicibacterium pulveris]|uniref:Cys-tRNA(Pro)/Cys-tRNA(Cys) deacylase n=1 Tax=Mycolicibacterium pulveris TaxID=36813 RepID=A0A7I7UDS2_MYCPV|nr:Cys-tRNA(Pro) deacylase [Mycolicibacterium pulveris]MCV6979166.1 Cys-tRNA(Pro) deacylase [Mycolicibacterium pulveris]BBY79624.1 Cys-tRNA(Pro)/Cys-tRNA(Cys) deacylase [Mycolicibacterium pulveris]